jgi:hypothetical protein
MSTRPLPLLPSAPPRPAPAGPPAPAAAGRRLDPVLLALAGLLLVLSLLAPARAGATLLAVARSLVAIAPWFALSVAVAAAAKATGADQLVTRAFAGRPGRMVAAASLVGALSPFCSCGVIPVVAGLLRAGVPLAPVMAFWISSPLMDPNQFLLITAQLGAGFAVAKTVAAIGMGLGSGLALLLVDRLGGARDGLRLAPAPCCGGPAGRPPAPAWRFWREPARRRLFAAEAGAISWFLGRWLTLAFAVQSLMVAWLPAPAVAAWVGTDGAWAVPLAVLVGIPAYLNGFAAIPLVAGLRELGMAPGAGLAFMLAGGVTSIPAMIAVFALVRPRIFAWYLLLAVAGALASGYLYDAALRVLSGPVG